MVPVPCGGVLPCLRVAIHDRFHTRWTTTMEGGSIILPCQIESYNTYVWSLYVWCGCKFKFGLAQAGPQTDSGPTNTQGFNLTVATLLEVRSSPSTPSPTATPHEPNVTVARPVEFELWPCCSSSGCCCSGIGEGLGAWSRAAASYSASNNLALCRATHTVEWKLTTRLTTKQMNQIVLR